MAKKQKIVIFFIILLTICKIIDVCLAIFYDIGSVSFEFDGAYYSLLYFVTNQLFKESILVKMTLFFMIILTIFSVLIKYELLPF